MHWFAGVLQSLSAIRSAGSILSARDPRGFRGLNHLCIAKMACKRALDRERGPRRPFGVVLLRHGITEQRVTELLGDVAALKGSASSLYSPRGNYPSNIVPLGPMLAIFEASRGTSHQQ